MDVDTLSIDCSPKGHNGVATLTARLGNEVLAVESLDLTRPKARGAFAGAICGGRPGIERKAVESELLRLAGDVAHKGDDDKPGDTGGLSEIDVSQIVRPERFVTPEVSGLTVPTMALGGDDDRPVGRWFLYLCWADGKRQRQLIRPTIDLPGGGKLWILPQPSAPTARTPRGWSAAARKRWLGTGAAPDPAELFRGLCKRIAYFLDLPRAHAPGMTALLALWAILTYSYQTWGAVPYLFIGGPLGSGKSRAFDVLARLVFRPISSSNVTCAALFRTLHNQGGTLLFDEAERLKQANSPEVGELLSMLLAGYRRGGQATRMEAVGDTFKTVGFDVYGSKALACVTGLPPALASRCIPLMMFRAGPGSEKPRRRIDADPAGWQRLRDDLHSLAMNHGPTWLELPGREDVCPPMSGRDYELWQPILALASWVESHGAQGLLELMQRHALAVIDSGREDQTPDHDELLLKSLADNIRGGYAPTAGEVLAKALEIEPKTFKQWTARGVSSHLKRYGLITHKSCGRKVYGRVTLDELRVIQDHYAVDLGLDDESAGT